MSWLVIAYYAIIVSKGISLADCELAYKLTSPFVPAVRTTRDFGELLIKQFSNLNTGHVAKLRGVTSNVKPAAQSHKRATHLEVFICVCIYTYVQTLRSVITLVNDKLQRAGDVELNPGPETPPSSPSATNNAENQFATPIEATDPNQQLPADKGPPLGPPSIPQSPSTTPEMQGAHFTYGKEVNDPMDTSSHDQKYPPPQKESQPQRKKKSKIPQHSKSFHKSNTEDRVASRKLQENKVKQLWERIDLDRLEASQVFDFLVAANELYRDGYRCDYCPLCLKRKDEVDPKGKDKGHRRSHVIPRSILEHYWKIHGLSEAYILDFSMNEHLSPQGVTYQLLCGNCETFYSVAEKSLLNLYLDVASHPYRDITIVHKEMEHSMKLPKGMKSNLWLRYILANILFRGILANVDMGKKIIENQAIYHLWRFCRRESSNVYDDLKIFLLRNRPFYEDANDDTVQTIMYPFEMFLRMPQCTELVEHKEIGPFFYTKFDCFHIALPLCDKSRDYFDTFNDGLTEYEHHCEEEDCDIHPMAKPLQMIHLRMTVNQKAEASREGKVINSYYPLDDGTVKDHFPEALLGSHDSMYDKLTSKLYNHTGIKKPFQAFMMRYRGACYVRFGTDHRMTRKEELKRLELRDQRASKTFNYGYFCENNDCIEQASQYSPFKRIQELGKARERCEKLEREKDEEATAHAGSRKKLEEKNCELAQVKTKLETEQVAHVATKEALGNLQQTLDDKKSALAESEKVCNSLTEAFRKQCKVHEERYNTLKIQYRRAVRCSKSSTPAAGAHNDVPHIQEQIYDRIKLFDRLSSEVRENIDIFRLYKRLQTKYENLLKESPSTSPTSLYSPPYY